jgi:hypothetical protein
MSPKGCCLATHSFNFNNSVTTGPNWTPEVIKAATAAGLHVSALIPENAQLIWEDIEYQVKVGFVRMIAASNLFGENQPPNLKVSRVAVVPQDNRCGRIILNLSAVADPKYADNRKAPGPSAAPTPSPGRPQNQPAATRPSNRWSTTQQNLPKTNPALKHWAQHSHPS